MYTSATTTNAGLTRPVTLRLPNLGGSADAQVVEELLKYEPGVVKVSAIPATDKVYIEYEVAITNPARLRDVVKQAGLGPKKAHVTCRHCR